MDPNECQVQEAGKKRRRPLRRSLSIVASSILCHQLLGMTSIAAAGPRVLSRHSRSAGLKGYRRFFGQQGCHHSSLSGLGFVSLPPYPSYDASRCCTRSCFHDSCQYKLKYTARNFSARSSSQLFLQQHGDTEIDEQQWKSFTDELNETLELPSISVPARHVHGLLSDKESPIKQFLATQMVELEGVHPKIKVVRDCNNQQDETVHDGGKKPQRRKRILLDSHLTSGEGIEDNSHNTEGSLLQLTQQLPGLSEDILHKLVEEFGATLGEPECINIQYKNQPINHILSKILPPEAQPPPSSYEQVGHVVHMNLKQHHKPYGNLIGRVMLDRLKPTIRTVVDKIGEVGGPFRTYPMGLLAGDDDYSVNVNEHGVSLFFDLRKVYWCTRLEGERTYSIENEFKPNQLIADAFCGVGALCVRAASAKGCRVVANDLNPDAVAYCKDSARRNGIDTSEGGSFRVQCGDASQFIMNLGIGVSESSSSADAAVPELPDHLLMNFPLDSPSFLNSLRWWPSGEKIETQTRVHLYTFARGDEERTPAEVAIDMVAEGLLPEGGYVEPSKFRGEYLNELGCNIQAREIRDAAPNKLVVCVSFSVTRTLLRRMQGDYGLD